MKRLDAPAPRSGMASWFGRLHARRLHPDGTAVASSFLVIEPSAQECDFWLCTCREQADNADYFFGPTAA